MTRDPHPNSVNPTARLRLTTGERAALFARAGGRCQTCGMALKPGRSWEIDHIIPLSLGGPSCASNLQILCRPCHRAKTTAHDIPRLAKALRLKAAHTGTQALPRQVLPGSRRSPWKKTLSGQVIRRASRVTPEDDSPPAGPARKPLD